MKVARKSRENLAAVVSCENRVKDGENVDSVSSFSVASAYNVPATS